MKFAAPVLVTCFFCAGEIFFPGVAFAQTTRPYEGVNDPVPSASQPPEAAGVTGEQEAPDGPIEMPPPLPDEEGSGDSSGTDGASVVGEGDWSGEYPNAPAAMLHFGEAVPWAAMGVIVHTGSKAGQPWFFALGGGRFKAKDYLHASEQLDIEVTARSGSAGMQWNVLAPFFALRASLGLTVFSGSFTQRGTDISGMPSAAEFLGSGFDGQTLHSAFATVLTGKWGRVRYELVPVGFRFTLARKLDQDLPTAHKVGLLRYMGGNTVFGVVNFAAGVEF